MPLRKTSLRSMVAVGAAVVVALIYVIAGHSSRSFSPEMRVSGESAQARGHLANAEPRVEKGGTVDIAGAAASADAKAAPDTSHGALINGLLALERSDWPYRVLKSIYASKSPGSFALVRHTQIVCKQLAMARHNGVDFSVNSVPLAELPVQRQMSMQHLESLCAPILQDDELRKPSLSDSNGERLERARWTGANSHFEEERRQGSLLFLDPTSKAWASEPALTWLGLSREGVTEDGERWAMVGAAQYEARRALTGDSPSNFTNAMNCVLLGICGDTVDGVSKIYTAYLGSAEKQQLPHHIQARALLVQKLLEDARR